MNQLPLEGLRVIDLGQVYAGPLAARTLADMGAEVIRVESAMRSGRGGVKGQPGVVYPDGVPGERPYNRSAYYNELHRNKIAISLDLSQEPGQRVFKKLVGISDVVIENFSPRVMANFGLEYAVLSRINPRIIMVSISGYGQTGPYRDYVSFGRGIEAMSGLSEITGYADGQPLGPGIAYADANAGLHAAFVVLAALRQRRRTHQGQHIDLALRESLTALIGEHLLGYSMNRRLPVRLGNQDSPEMFQGCYRCKGDDQWIAIAVGSEEEWEALWRVIGLRKVPATSSSNITLNPLIPQLFGGNCSSRGAPPCPRQEESCTSFGRENSDEVNRLIETWTTDHEAQEAMVTLQQAGIRAGRVCGTGELLADPHLRARGFFEAVAHPEAGTYPHAGMPWKFSQTPLSIRTPAPCFGQHGGYVFGDLLGMSEDEIAKLEQEGVIATIPAR